MNEAVQQVLMSGRRIESRIRAKQAEMRHYRELATSISPNYDGLPHGSSASSKVESAVLRIVALTEEIAAESEQLVAYRKYAKAIIDGVPELRQRDVLTYRYLNGYEWETVCILMDKSRTQVWRIHAEALDAAQQSMDKLAEMKLMQEIFSGEKRRNGEMKWNETFGL